MWHGLDVVKHALSGLEDIVYQPGLFANSYKLDSSMAPMSIHK